MEREVVRAREAALTVGTLERLHPGVFAVMACELVRTCELPRAAFPCAAVWLFTWQGAGKSE